MGNNNVRIKSIKYITHDVLKIETEKPGWFSFIPGQAVEISIAKPGWEARKRSFTMTSLPNDDYLEFIIKTYATRKGLTSELLKLNSGDELLLHDVFGTIEYKNEGVFIAGGAGITPFISILRYLKFVNRIGNNKLIFANKTRDDIIANEELSQMLGENFINILSDEESVDYPHGFITESFIKEHLGGIKKYFYVCGPPGMMKAVEKILSDIGIDNKHIIKEVF